MSRERVGRADHLIECGTRVGFRASLGRVTPAPGVQKRDAGLRPC
jgi:hypothetical protein